MGGKLEAACEKAKTTPVTKYSIAELEKANMDAKDMGVEAEATQSAEELLQSMKNHHTFIFKGLHIEFQWMWADVNALAPFNPGRWSGSMIAAGVVTDLERHMEERPQDRDRPISVKDSAGNQEKFDNSEQALQAFRGPQAEASKSLDAAVSSRKIHELEESIQKAAEAKLAEDLITPAREVLEEERKKDRAMKSLDAAREAHELEESIKEAREVGVAEDLIAPYQAALESEWEKEGRISVDGNSYTLQEFKDFFKDDWQKEWSVAMPVKVAAAHMESLKAAVSSRKIDELEASIKEANEAGLAEVLVAPACVALEIEKKNAADAEAAYQQSKALVDEQKSKRLSNRFTDNPYAIKRFREYDEKNNFRNVMKMEKERFHNDTRMSQLTAFFEFKYDAYCETFQPCPKEEWALWQRPDGKMYVETNEVVLRGQSLDHRSFAAAMWGADFVYQGANDNLLKDDPEQILNYAPFYASLVDYIESEGSGPEPVTLYRVTRIAECQMLEVEAPKGETRQAVLESKCFRQPMFVAGMNPDGAQLNAEERATLKKLCQSKTSPILKFEVPAGCKYCRKLQTELAAYPKEKEYLISPYAPIRYVSEESVPDFLGDGERRLVITLEILEEAEDMTLPICLAMCAAKTVTMKAANLFTRITGIDLASLSDSAQEQLKQHYWNHVASEGNEVLDVKVSQGSIILEAVIRVPEGKTLSTIAEGFESEEAKGKLIQNVLEKVPEIPIDSVEVRSAVSVYEEERDKQLQEELRREEEKRELRKRELQRKEEERAKASERLAAAEAAATAVMDGTPLPSTASSAKGKGKGAVGIFDSISSIVQPIVDVVNQRLRRSSEAPRKDAEEQAQEEPDEAK